MTTTPKGAPQGEAPTGGDRLLTIEEATQQLSVSKDWLYRHAKALPFTVPLGTRLRFSERGLERWVRQRQAR